MAKYDFATFKTAYHLQLKGFVGGADFDRIVEYTEMCKKHSTEAVDDYRKRHDSLEGFEERYCGEWDSEEDIALHIVESCYDLESRMDDLQHYFDYEA